MSEFQLAADTHIGYAHLRVADLNRSLGFYRDQLGLTEIRRDGDTSYLSADGSEPAIIILTEDPDAPPKPRRSTGLYHVAIRLPSRKALAETFRQLVVKQVPFSGFSDHLVSEALYLPDPDDNGLELYRDRPREEWRMSNGAVAMDTLPLDLDDLLGEAGDEPYTGIDPATDIGHIHLHVSSLPRAEAFYVDLLGFDAMQRSYPGALFVAAGGYHHHIGLNTWAGTTPPPADAIGLVAYSVVIPSVEAFAAVVERANEAGIPVTSRDGRTFVSDQDGNSIELVQE